MFLFWILNFDNRRVETFVYMVAILFDVVVKKSFEELITLAWFGVGQQTVDFYPVTDLRIPPVVM